MPFVHPCIRRVVSRPKQSTSGAQVRVATERSLGKESGERIVYVKGNKAQRDAALDMIRSNPKVGVLFSGPDVTEPTAWTRLRIFSASCAWTSADAERKSRVREAAARKC